jgi:hypothetical protein
LFPITDNWRRDAHPITLRHFCLHCHTQTPDLIMSSVYRNQNPAIKRRYLRKRNIRKIISGRTASAIMLQGSTCPTYHTCLRGPLLGLEEHCILRFTLGAGFVGSWKLESINQISKTTLERHSVQLVPFPSWELSSLSVIDPLRHFCPSAIDPHRSRYYHIINKEVNPQSDLIQHL